MSGRDLPRNGHGNSELRILPIPGPLVKCTRFSFDVWPFYFQRHAGT
jgi:hypothetical protein